MLLGYYQKKKKKKKGFQKRPFREKYQNLSEEEKGQKASIYL